MALNADPSVLDWDLLWANGVQQPYGGWTADWSKRHPDVGRPLVPDMTELIAITSHHLEWLCVADASLRPTASVTQAAWNFVASALPEQIQQLPYLDGASYCAVSHACNLANLALMQSRSK